MTLFQNSPGMHEEIASVGCTFMLFPYFRDVYQHQPMDLTEINFAWIRARNLGIINPASHPRYPLHITDYQRLVNFLGVKLRVLFTVDADGRPTTHWPLDTPIGAGQWGMYAWYNPATSVTHFVSDKERPVRYDPWLGGSRTVREGAPKPDGLRLFQITI